MTVKTRNILLGAMAAVALLIILVLVFSGKKGSRPEPETLSKTTENGIVA